VFGMVFQQAIGRIVCKLRQRLQVALIRSSPTRMTRFPHILSMVNLRTSTHHPSAVLHASAHYIVQRLCLPGLTFQGQLDNAAQQLSPNLGPRGITILTADAHMTNHKARFPTQGKEEYHPHLPSYCKPRHTRIPTQMSITMACEYQSLFIPGWFNHHYDSTQPGETGKVKKTLETHDPSRNSRSTPLTINTTILQRDPVRGNRPVAWAAKSLFDCMSWDSPRRISPLQYCRGTVIRRSALRSICLAESRR
jgi:hypothetical protein